MNEYERDSWADFRTAKLRRWIFAYFLLLIFEGALRKWFSFNFAMSAAFMLVRDPVVLIIYYLAWRSGAFPKGRFMRIWGWTCVILGLLGLLQLLVNPWLKPLVVVYGLRCYCLHMPLILVIAHAFEKDDILRVGRWLMLLSVPMALLMLAQFFSPPDSILNRATLGEGSTQLGGALGRIRPAGFFSYGTGATTFNLLMACFLLYSFVDKTWVSLRVRIAAALSLVVTLPISISRTYVMSFGLLFLFFCFSALYDRRQLRAVMSFTLLGTVAFMGLSFADFFREGLAAFLTRWEAALGPTYSVNDAIVRRFLGEFVNAFEYLGSAPFFGYGLGLSSNVGSALTVRSITFLLAENEWERTVLEMGPVVAVYWLTVRCSLGVALYRRAWRCLRYRYALPWLLVGTQCLGFFNGWVEQSTNLGFLVFTAGLCLAASRAAEEEESERAALEAEVEDCEEKASA